MSVDKNCTQINEGQEKIGNHIFIKLVTRYLNPFRPAPG